MSPIFILHSYSHYPPLFLSFLYAAAVVLAFFICWAPFHAQRLLYVVFYQYEWKFVSEGVYQQINEKLFYITGCFYYFSSTVNPILYNVMSVKYR
jgi:neuromedin U receptor 1